MFAISVGLSGFGTGMVDYSVDNPLEVGERAPAIVDVPKKLFLGLEISALEGDSEEADILLVSVPANLIDRYRTNTVIGDFNGFNGLVAVLLITPVSVTHIFEVIYKIIPKFWEFGIQWPTNHYIADYSEAGYVRKRRDSEQSQNRKNFP